MVILPCAITDNVRFVAQFGCHKKFIQNQPEFCRDDRLNSDYALQFHTKAEVCPRVLANRNGGSRILVD
jgi:hypothetical protein